MIHRAVMSGMISSGANATDLSVLPAPVARYWARHNHVSAVHVQTSPVDPRSADIRIFDDHGLDLDKRSERKLENLFFREDIRRVSHYEMGRIIRRDGQTDRYLEDMLAKLDLETVRGAAFKVLVDYNNGAAALVLPRVLQEMNCTVIPLSAAPAEIVVEQDASTFNAHLLEMGVIVSAVKARLGIFIDTPGERCFLIDETGAVLDHDTAFAVLAQLALSVKPGMLLGPASSSLAFSMIADQMQSRFVPTKITPGAVLRRPTCRNRSRVGRRRRILLARLRSVVRRHLHDRSRARAARSHWRLAGRTQIANPGGGASDGGGVLPLGGQGPRDEDDDGTSSQRPHRPDRWSQGLRRGRLGPGGT
jgi:mannose-1-phosphate guanylyltransferase/phosphomannomutase